MQTILGLGKYLFAIPFLIFGVFHLMGADNMASMAFGSAFLIYLTGLCLILATVSIILGRYDKLATVLLGLFMLLTATLVHLSGALDGDQASTGNLLKDLSLAGGSWLYASHIARDKAIIG